MSVVIAVRAYERRGCWVLSASGASYWRPARQIGQALRPRVRHRPHRCSECDQIGHNAARHGRGR